MYFLLTTKIQKNCENFVLHVTKILTQQWLNGLNMQDHHHDNDVSECPQVRIEGGGLEGLNPSPLEKIKKNFRGFLMSWLHTH